MNLLMTKTIDKPFSITAVSPKQVAILKLFVVCDTIVNLSVRGATLLLWLNAVHWTIETIYGKFVYIAQIDRRCSNYIWVVDNFIIY